MKGKSWSRLKVPEYLGLLVVGIAIIIAIAKPGLVLLPVVLLFITLLLNAMNHLGFEQEFRRRLFDVANKYNLLNTAVGDLDAQVSKYTQQSVSTFGRDPMTLQGRSPGTETPTTIDSSPYLQSIENSLTSVVEYLNRYQLAERLERLEEENKQLKSNLNAVLRYINSGAVQASSAIAPSAATGPSFQFPPLKDPQKQPQWRQLYTLSGHGDCVTALAISNDGRFLLSGSWDHSVKLWSLATGKLVSTTIAHNQGILGVSFVQDPSAPGEIYQFITSSFEDVVKVWQLDLQGDGGAMINLVHSLIGHSGSVRSLALSPDHNYLVTGSYDHTIKKWHLSQAQEVFSGYHNDEAIQSVAISPDGQVIASGGGEGRIWFWDFSTGQKLGSVLGDRVVAVESMGFHPQSDLFVTGGVDGSMDVWRFNPGDYGQCEILYSVKGHDGQITDLQFSKMGDMIYSSGVDGRICMWRLGEKEPTHEIYFSEEQTGNHCRTLSLVLSPDGELLVAGGANGQIKVWLQE